MRTQSQDKSKSDLVGELIGEECDNSHTHKADGTFQILNEIVVDRGPNPSTYQNRVLSRPRLTWQLCHLSKYSEMMSISQPCKPMVSASQLQPVPQPTTSLPEGRCVTLKTPSSWSPLSVHTPFHSGQSYYQTPSSCEQAYRTTLGRLHGRVSTDEKGASCLSIAKKCSCLTLYRVELHPGDYVTISASRYPFASVQPQGRRSEDWVNSISRTLQWNSRQRQKSFKEWQET